MDNHNYRFNDRFFQEIKAPKYQLEVVSAQPLTYGAFPPLDSVLFRFFGESGWTRASDAGITYMEKNLKPGFYAAGPDIWTAQCVFNIPENLPNVTQVQSIVMPGDLRNEVIAFDPMTMDGTMHDLEAMENYGDWKAGYVQVSFTSALKHGPEGEPHTGGVIRTGVIFKKPGLPAGVSAEDTFAYTVDYRHLFVCALADDDPIQTLRSLYLPAHVDFSHLYRPAGTYNVKKNSKYILFRIL